MFTRFLISLLLLLFPVPETSAQNPLAPLDTSSPRATMASFLAITEDVERRYLEYRKDPGPASQRRLQRSMAKGRGLLDLRKVPPALHHKIASQSFILLWDVTARLELPKPETIPGESADTADAKGVPPARWRIPETEITIARVQDGERAGEFLFSADTVERLPAFYEASRGMPYLRTVPMGNLVRASQLITGWMIPLAWIETLPDFANTPVLGQLLWKWVLLIVVWGLALWVMVAVWRWVRRKPWEGSLGSYVRYLISPLTILVLVSLLRHVEGNQILVSGFAADATRILLELASSVAGVWIIWLTAGRVADIIVMLPRIQIQSLDAHLVRLATRVIGLAAMLALIFDTATVLGIPAYGLVAGAGVGGLAVALAARSTLENFLGTLNLYADRPVRVGDFCRYGEDASGWMRLGTVEEIGLRSTQIRGIDRTVTTIPNADFARTHIVNLTRRDSILLTMTIGLRYETTSDQLRFVLAELREMLLAHPAITKDPARARAIGFGQSSLDVQIFAYVRTSEWNEFLAVQEDVVLRIMDIVRKAGTGFAFPSRTFYHARDSGLDREKQGVAEKTVREWAATHILPFPDFHPDHRRRVMDSLDYPPEGSPSARKD